MTDALKKLEIFYLSFFQLCGAGTVCILLGFERNELTMFDDLDPPKKKTGSDFLRNLEKLSVGELEEYIGELKAEITRVEADKNKKKASQDAAAAAFKL